MSKRERMQKQAPKNAVKLDITLNAEQQDATALIKENVITFVNGKAGSGKTLTAIHAALSALHSCEVNKIVISRPVVTANEDLGFLPGDINDKMDPFMIPIFDNLKKVYNKKETNTGKSLIEKYIEREEIQICPIAYLRGRTFDNAYVIVDEAQNLTEEQMLMVLTRVGKNGKLIFTGDIDQCDLKKRCQSGLALLQHLIRRNNLSGLRSIDLQENHRDPIVSAILNEVDIIKAER